MNMGCPFGRMSSQLSGGGMFKNLSGQRTEGGPRARVRPVSWERLLELQGLQREDYLRQFMEKQQRIARGELQSRASGAGPGAGALSASSQRAAGG